MKKLIALLTTLVMVVGLLAACGGTKPAETTKATDAATTAAPAETTAGTDAAPAGEGYVPNPADYKLIDVAHFDKEWNIDSEALGTFTMDLSTHDPATSMKAQFLEEWCQLIREATNGGVDITVYVGGTLASPGEALSAVEMGTADLAWFIGSNFADVLPATGMFYLPGLGLGRNVVDCDVMWDMYEKYPQMQAEYEASNLKLVHLYTTGTVTISGAKVTSLDELKGKNIRTTGGYAADIMTELGASPISMGPGDMYDALSKGVLDDYAIEWSGIKTFRTYEVSDYYNTDGLWVTVMGLIMNLDSYNNLPAEYQEVIDYYSGREMSLQQAYLWGVENAECQGELSKPEQIVTFSAEEKDKMLEICKKYSEDKAKEISTADFDAEAFLQDIYDDVEAHADYKYYRE